MYNNVLRSRNHALPGAEAFNIRHVGGNRGTRHHGDVTSRPGRHRIRAVTGPDLVPYPCHGGVRPAGGGKCPVSRGFVDRDIVDPPTARERRRDRRPARTLRPPRDVGRPVAEPGSRERWMSSCVRDTRSRRVPDRRAGVVTRHRPPTPGDATVFSARTERPAGTRPPGSYRSGSSRGRSPVSSRCMMSTANSRSRSSSSSSSA